MDCGTPRGVRYNAEAKELIPTITRTHMATVNALVLAELREDEAAFEAILKDADPEWRDLAEAAIAMLCAMVVQGCRAMGVDPTDMLERAALVYATLPEQLEDIDTSSLDDDDE